MKILKCMSMGLAFAGAILAGCSSKVYVQRDESTDLAKFRTYMWVETQANKDQTNGNRYQSFAESAIHNAVNAELYKEGWKEVTDNPDVLVSHDILIQRSTQQTTEPVYSPVYRWYYNPWARRWGTIYYPSQFVGFDTYTYPVREATVSITMVDAQTDKTVWQAWTTEQMDNRRMTASEIDKAVHSIFKKFDTAVR